MALLINNESPQNIIYNSNEVLKVIYNDIVVWEKQNEQQVYKRRIMVGDNLRNKVVYGDFKMGYYVTLMNADEEDSITCNNNRLDTVYEYITSDYCSVDNNMRDSSSNLSLYEYDATNGTEILNNNSLIKNDKDYIVSEIIDNATYRHLFIEDPNIRPIKVGDKVVSGTKFYGVVPDDYNANNINSAIQDNNNNTVGYFSFYENIAELWIASSQTSVDYIFQKNPYYSINNSQITSQTEYTVGSITNETNPNFAYLLVDTTTLGE